MSAIFLLNLSKEMTEAYKAGDEKGLSVEELAFYDALVADPEVLRKMQDKVLIEMAQELEPKEVTYDCPSGKEFSLAAEGAFLYGADLPGIGE